MKVSPFTGSASAVPGDTGYSGQSTAHEGLESILHPGSGEEAVLSSPDGRTWLVSSHDVSHPQGVAQAVRVRSGLDALLSELEQARVLDDNAINRIKDSISRAGRVARARVRPGVWAPSRERGAPGRTTGSTQT